MTLIHLYRKYKAWNPVHATAGVFWGFGLGLGCGVGWGPGFGPEVVGYVGSGCGVGLSVGITLVGFGVGLPAAGAAALPWNTLQYTARQGTSRRGEALRAALRAWDWAASSKVGCAVKAAMGEGGERMRVMRVSAQGAVQERVLRLREGVLLRVPRALPTWPAAADAADSWSTKG